MPRRPNIQRPPHVAENFLIQASGPAPFREVEFPPAVSQAIDAARAAMNPAAFNAELMGRPATGGPGFATEIVSTDTRSPEQRAHDEQRAQNVLAAFAPLAGLVRAERTTPLDDPAEAFINDREPEVGMGVTVLAWGGRFAGTIVRMNRRKTRIVVKRDRVCLHVGRMQDGFRFEPDPDGFESIFTKRPGGAWVRQGRRLGVGVTELWIGTRSETSTITIEGV